MKLEELSLMLVAKRFNKGSDINVINFFHNLKVK